MSIITHDELKALQSQRDKTRASLELARAEQRDANKKVNDLHSKLTSLERRIKDLTYKAAEVGEIVVTEHAFLRYFERVLGMDLEEIRKKIVTPEIELQIKTLKSGVFPGEGYRLRVKDGAVVTLLTNIGEGV